MTLPLVVLAVLTIGGGAINLSAETGWLHRWLEDSVVAFHGEVHPITHAMLIALALGAAVLGIVGAAALYLRRAPDREPLAVPLGGLYRFAAEKFYVDELYRLLIVTPGRVLADAMAFFDRRVIDGAVNGAASGTAALATVGRRMQTGYVRSYALAVVLGTLIIAVLLYAGAAWIG